MGAPIVHWEINTQNLDRVLDFYRSMFGWQVDVNAEMKYGLVNTGSKSGIGGGIGQTQSGTPNLVTFYIEVDNPQEVLDKATSMGASVVVPVTEIPNMVTFAQFKDPDGNIIGLLKSVERPSRQRARRPARRAKSTRKPAKRKRSRR